ncbi:HpcH/HpaI aldolase/citrate lyase family protein [Ruegeria sp.]|uniref:HpcH/HpaI aldolase/citrate lyase family protein n=1 Tax=Ruegeria sp. TaxID=1879320 RepID=UPI003C7C967C
MPLPSHGARSWLFVPGNDFRKLSKSLTSGADVIIFDLEDAVSSDGKAAARALTARALQSDSRPARYVRVNDLTTGLTAEDVAQTIGALPDGYVLPKCDGPRCIEQLAKLIRDHAPAKMPGILAICTETVRGVRNLMRLDWSHPMLVGLTWGGEDLMVDLGARSNRGDDGHYLSPFSMARDLTLYAAKEAGVLAIDAVFTDFRDISGLHREAQGAGAVGFDGKLAIHPAQLDVIHDALAFEAEQVRWAERVIAALAASEIGVAELDGKMLDRPHFKQAEMILRNGGRALKSPGV